MIWIIFAALWLGFLGEERLNFDCRSGLVLAPSGQSSRQANLSQSPARSDLNDSHFFALGVAADE